MSENRPWATPNPDGSISVRMPHELLSHLADDVPAWLKALKISCRKQAEHSAPFAAKAYRHPNPEIQKFVADYMLSEEGISNVAERLFLGCVQEFEELSGIDVLKNKEKTNVAV